jgi:putative membrane protein
LFPKEDIMRLIAQILVALVALEHVWFLILEMFLWTTPLGLRTFGQSLERARDSAILAANQGLYNGFLAAGLIWSLVSGPLALPLQTFFLSCVVVAGVFGALTANRAILWAQAVPGAVALALVLLAAR